MSRGQCYLVPVLTLAFVAGFAYGQPEPVRGVTLLQPVIEGQPIRGLPADDRLAEAVTEQPLGNFTPYQPVPCEVRPPGCHPFEYRFRSGALFQVFPSTLLWEPPLAQKGQPRLEALFTTLDDATSQQTVDTHIGATAGLFRYTFAENRWAVQLDFFAVVGSRFSAYDYLIASDYRAGLPITWTCGPWHGKFGYEHTSTHMGDDLMVLNDRQPIPSVKDELVLGLGRWFWNQLRVYSEFGYAFYLNTDNPDTDPVRFALGAEWRTRNATGFWGRPFGAVNLAFPGDQNYKLNLTVQAGWMWRQPAQRLANLRVFGEYYTGRAPFGQLYHETNQFFGIGLAVDY